MSAAHWSARVGALALAAGMALSATAASAMAKTMDTPGPDDRATLIEGNVRPGDCDAAGLAGDEITDRVTASVSEDGIYLDITAVDDGVEVSGIVVKGGPDTYVYPSDTLGDLPWEDLRSPLNPGGQIPQISHWFACGAADSEPTPGEMPDETPSETPDETESPDETKSPAGPGGPGDETTQGVAGKDLADTGFSTPWLAALALALLMGGLALYLAATRKGSQRI